MNHALPNKLYNLHGLTKLGRRRRNLLVATFAVSSLPVHAQPHRTLRQNPDEVDVVRCQDRQQRGSDGSGGRVRGQQAKVVLPNQIFKSESK